MMQFAWIELLLLLPLPWLIYRLLPAAKHQQEAALYAPFVEQLSLVEDKRTSSSYQRWPLWLAVVAWILLVVAAARPEWLGEPLAVPQTGRNLILAVDVSGSMEAPDLAEDGSQSTRLDVVKNVAGNFVQQRTGDRVGLILFGSQAYLQSPLTFDHLTVKHFLSDALIGIAGRETAIGDAIGLAVKRLREAPGKDAVLILLTDGQNTAGIVAPKKAAELAQQSGLKIYTIGIGADQMRIRSLFGSRTINPSADLDEEMLRYIAETTGGQYFRARSQNDLAAIYQQLDRLESVVGKKKTVRPVTALYFWPLSIAVLISFVLVLNLLLGRGVSHHG